MSMDVIYYKQNLKFHLKDALWRIIFLKLSSSGLDKPLLFYHSFFAVIKYQILKEFCRYARTSAFASGEHTGFKGPARKSDLDFQFCPSNCFTFFFSKNC